MMNMQSNEDWAAFAARVRRGRSDAEPDRLYRRGVASSEPENKKGRRTVDSFWNT